MNPLEGAFPGDYFIPSWGKPRRWNECSVFKYSRYSRSSACDLHLRVMASDLVFLFSFHLWLCECGKAACCCENGNEHSASIN